MFKIFHSPDADDLIIFWKLIEARSPTGDRTYDCRAYDTERLNQSAISGEPDICAVSAATLPLLRGRYCLSPYGASIGRGFGPVVISRKLTYPNQLNSAKIGIPGPTTTAALVLSKLAPNALTVTIPITPFEAVFRALDANEIDAAVLIHEGQLAYERYGYKKITDLGSWWMIQTGLPLPLGVNVIKIHEDRNSSLELNQLLKASVDYGLANAEDLLTIILSRDESLRSKLESKTAFSSYLMMYANEDSRELKADVYAGLEVLLDQSFDII